MNNHSLAIPGQGPVSLAYSPVAIAAADPRREIRTGLIIGALFFIGLLGWAAVARLDAAAIAPGRLVVSGQRQTVQHRDGGVVADIAVREGASVREGQILIQLAGAEVRAQERALAGQTITRAISSSTKAATASTRWFTKWVTRSASAIQALITRRPASRSPTGPTPNMRKTRAPTA